ncbi:MAG: bacteriohemerythrin [Armatimonadota bacterium]
MRFYIMAIEWNERLSVGIDEIDNQHKELINRINKLTDAIESNKGNLEIKSTVKFLQDYVVMHFGSEEKIMESEKYPEFVKHKQIHNDFVSNFKELQNKLANDSISQKIIDDLNKSVVKWVIKHVCFEDKLIGNHLRKKQIFH